MSAEVDEAEGGAERSKVPERKWFDECAGEELARWAEGVEGWVRA